MRRGTCKHYRGAFHKTECKAGVLFDDVVPEPERREGYMLRIPCIQDQDRHKLSVRQLDEFRKRGSCDQYEEPTDEEIASFEEGMKKRVEMMQATIPLIQEIKEIHRGENWNGTVVCPICEGKLSLTHSAYNGHVWGKCETEGCLSWME